MTAAVLPRRHRSRSLHALSLIFAAFLGFITSPLITGHNDCRFTLPHGTESRASIAAPLVALRVAAREFVPVIAEPESDLPPIATWIDDHAILLLEIAVAFVAFLALLLALAMYFGPYKPIELEHLADGDTGPWLRGEPDLYTPEDK